MLGVIRLRKAPGLRKNAKDHFDQVFNQTKGCGTLFSASRPSFAATVVFGRVGNPKCGAGAVTAAGIFDLP